MTLRPEPDREDHHLDAHRWNDGSQAVPASDEAAISLPDPLSAAADDSENSESSEVEGEQAAEDSEAEEEREQSGSAERAWRETVLSDAATRLRPGGIDQRGGVNLSMLGSSFRDVIISSQSPDVLTPREHHRPVVNWQPVPRRELQLVIGAYVPPEEYDHAAYVLKRDGLLVLQAPRRSGKRTTALHLLCKDAQAPEVSEWPARGLDLAQLRERIRPDRRYLIDGLEPDVLSESGQISPFGLRGLAHDLATRRSRLVITVHSELSDASQERLDYLVQLESLPNLEQVLLAHVQAHLPRSLEQRDTELLRNPLVGARLNAAAELADVARLAERLAFCIRDGSDLGRVLESRADMARKTAQQFLGEAADVERCALLLAVSVLGGSTDTIVFHEAAQLEGILCRDIPPQPPQPWRLDSTRSDRLNSIKASVHPGTERRRKFGSSRVDTVEFDDGELASQVLDVAWREHLALRGPLLEWLKSTESRYRSYEIRGKTAVAVAKLATISFNQVLEHVIDGWAKAGNAHTRELAGEALALTAVSRIHAHPVFRLLSYWIEHRSVHHQIVATVAYQRLCRDYPPEAVNGLGRLVTRHVGRSRDEQLDRQLDRAIGTALTEMLKIAPTLTLQRLVRLTEPGEPTSIQGRALQAFLHLASQWSADPARPLLVQCWQDAPETHDLIVALWSRTLQSRSLGAAGVAMLQRWHRRARRTTVDEFLKDVLARRVAIWQAVSESPSRR